MLPGENPWENRCSAEWEAVQQAGKEGKAKLGGRQEEQNLSRVSNSSFGKLMVVSESI